MSIKLAIQILNLDQDKSYHNALNDAYYTAQVFIRIYNPSIVPDVYMYTTVKPSSAKKNIKKQINYDKLFAEFAKILQRDLTKEENLKYELKESKEKGLFVFKTQTESSILYSVANSLVVTLTLT